MRTAAAEARRRCRRIGGSLKLDGSSVLIARPYDKNQIAKNKLAPEWGDFQTLATSRPPHSVILRRAERDRGTQRRRRRSSQRAPLGPPVSAASRLAGG